MKAGLTSDFRVLSDGSRQKMLVSGFVDYVLASCHVEIQEIGLFGCCIAFDHALEQSEGFNIYPIAIQIVERLGGNGELACAD